MSLSDRDWARMIVAGVMVRMSKHYPRMRNLDDLGEPSYVELHGVELNEAFNEGIDSAGHDRDAKRYLDRLERCSLRAWRRFRRDVMETYRCYL